MKQARFLSLLLAAMSVAWLTMPGSLAADPPEATAIPQDQVEEESPATGLPEENEPAVAPSEPDEAVTPEQPEEPAVVPAPPEEAPAPIIRPEKEKDKPAPAPRKRAPRKRSTTIHGSQNERVEVGRNVVIGRDEVVRELVVIAGNATIEGTVEGSLVVVSGSARINGRVNQDLVTILGSASLGPKARIGQDAVIVGGPLTVNNQATIGGQQTVIALGDMVPDFLWLQRWLSKGLFMARPLPPGVQWVWVAAGLCLLLYLALALIFPRPVRACVDTLERQPVASFFIGILLFVLLGPLVFLLAISVAGILVIPFLVCAVIAAVVFGKVVVYTFAGAQVGRQMHRPDISLPMVLLLGTILFYLIYMVPVLGFAVWGIVTLLGVGAVLLAAFGSFRPESTPAPAYAAVPSGELAMTSTMPSPSGTVGALLAPPVSAPIDFALLPRVGFWRRFTATFLDFVLLVLLIHLTGPLFLVLWAAYHLGMWAWKGTTIGGIVMGIKIVRLDGQPIDFGVALVRCLSSFFSAFALFLGFFWAGWDKERQAWHDKIAGTIVVKVPKGISLV